MRVAIDKLAAKLGVTPTESAVRAALGAPADEASHDAFMAQHFPTIRASLDANAKRDAMVAFDKRAREDPMATPGTPQVVTISPGSRGTPVVTPLPGLGRVRNPGRDAPRHL